MLLLPPPLWPVHMCMYCWYLMLSTTYCAVSSAAADACICCLYVYTAAAHQSTVVVVHKAAAAVHKSRAAAHESTAVHELRVYSCHVYESASVACKVLHQVCRCCPRVNGCSLPTYSYECELRLQLYRRFNESTNIVNESRAAVHRSTTATAA